MYAGGSCQRNATTGQGSSQSHQQKATSVKPPVKILTSLTTAHSFRGFAGSRKRRSMQLKASSRESATPVLWTLPV